MAPRKFPRGSAHLVRAADLRGCPQSRRDPAQLRLSRSVQHKALIDAWRERLKGSHAVGCQRRARRAPRGADARDTELRNFAGFSRPSVRNASPPLRHWEAVAARAPGGGDRRCCTRSTPCSRVTACGRSRPSASCLPAGRCCSLSELDIYPNAGPPITTASPFPAKARRCPTGRAGSGPRLFAYLYSYFKGLDPLLAAIAALKSPTLVFCRGIDPNSKRNTRRLDPLLGGSDVGVAGAAAGARPSCAREPPDDRAGAALPESRLLLLPTQLEQFLIMRRLCVRPLATRLRS